MPSWSCAWSITPKILTLFFDGALVQALSHVAFSTCKKSSHGAGSLHRSFFFNDDGMMCPWCSHKNKLYDNAQERLAKMMDIEDPKIRDVYWNPDNVSRKRLRDEAGLVAFASKQHIEWLIDMIT